MRHAAFTLVAGLALAAQPAVATDDCVADAMIVFDGSGSMAEVNIYNDSPARIDQVRTAVRRALPEVAAVRRLGLITFGGGPVGPCGGIDLRFRPRANAAPAIIAAIDALKPDGLTPLTAAVADAARVLDFRNRPATVVVVTDGNETCGGAPCAMGAALAAQGRDLTIHVIGFQVQVDYFAWDNPEQQAYGFANPVTKCLADATGGLYVTTQTVDQLVDALTRALGCAVIGQR
jgi:Ca-activated chloride channel family protein